MQPNRRATVGLLACTGTANISDGMVQVLLPLLAVSESRFPAAVTGVVAANTAPWIVFVLPAGLLIDRWSAMLVLRFGLCLRVAAVAALGLLWAAHVLTIPILIAGALGLGIVEVACDLAAQTLPPAIVPLEDLATLNSRIFSVQLVANRFAGPALAGVVTAVSLSALGATSAVTYGVAAIPARWLWRGLVASGRADPRRQPAHATGQSGLRRPGGVKEALRRVVGDHVLRPMAILVACLNLADGIIMGLLVLYATVSSGLGLSPSGYGWLVAAFGVGGLIGA